MTIILLLLISSSLLLASNEKLDCDESIEKQTLLVFLDKNPEVNESSVSSSLLDGGFILMDSPDQFNNIDTDRTYLSYIYETDSPSTALATYYILREKDSCQVETIRSM